MTPLIVITLGAIAGFATKLLVGAKQPIPVRICKQTRR